MKGLECSEINIKRIDGNLLRLEAEYYKKEYLQLENLIANFDNVEKFVNSIDCGPFGSNMRDTEYKEKGVLVVRPFNLKDSVVENDNLVYVSQELVDSNSLKIYNKGTLLFSRVGDIKVGVLNRDGATISPNIVAVRFNNEKISKFCAIYFQSYYGYLQIKRQLKIAAQPTISTEIIQNLKLPNLPNLIDKIAKIFDNAQAILQQSQSVYHSAEQLLLKSLGLENWQPKNEKTTVKKFSDYEKSGRLDAEYYQPKYEEIENRLQGLGVSDYATNFDICEKLKTPQKGVIYKYIELADIGMNGEITGGTKDYGENLPSRARRKVHCNDLIISSIEGSLQSCAIVSKEYDGAFCSTGFYILRAKNINVETLLVLLKSDCYQALLKKGCSGTILTAISLDELKKIEFPKIDISIQKDIADKVQESFRLRQESKELLECAKRAVEIAIEEGEDNAMEWLKNCDG